MIDVTHDPGEVIAAIAECEVVVSSSLHGLVVADSFDIPNHWVTCDIPLFGGTWKFDDYFAAFGLTKVPGRIDDRDDMAETLIADALDDYHRPGIANLKTELLGAFPSELR